MDPKNNSLESSAPGIFSAIFPFPTLNLVFPGGSMVKEICLPMQETWVKSLGQEDPLEKAMAIHPSVLA